MIINNKENILSHFIEKHNIQYATLASSPELYDKITIDEAFCIIDIKDVENKNELIVSYIPPTKVNLKIKTINQYDTNDLINYFGTETPTYNNNHINTNEVPIVGFIQESTLTEPHKDWAYAYSLLLDSKFKIKGWTILEKYRNNNSQLMTLTVNAMHHTLYNIRKNLNTWKIEIRNSMESKIKNTSISLPKEMFLKSKLLQDGISFIRKDHHLTIYIEDNNIIILYEPLGYISEYKNAGITPYIINIENMPNTITEKTIDLMLKNVSSEASKKIVSCNGNNKTQFNKYHNLCQQFKYINELESGKDISLHFDSVFYDAITTTIKLLTAYSSPKLRGEIKRIKQTKTQNTRLRTKKNIQYTKWVWGTDRIQYIYPNNKYNNKKSIHYCRPALAKYYISNLNKYKEYDILEEKRNHWRYRYSVIKWRAGCWKGDKEKYYFAGNIGGGYSQKAIAWLKRVAKENEINIQHAENNKEFRIQVDENNYYLVDGYCEENNTVYEFHGDFWHGNPKQYDANDINPKNNKTYGELYSATLMKEKMIKSMGFKLITIWENKWDKMVRA